MQTFPNTSYILPQSLHDLGRRERSESMEGRVTRDITATPSITAPPQVMIVVNMSHFLPLLSLPTFLILVLRHLNSVLMSSLSFFLLLVFGHLNSFLISSLSFFFSYFSIWLFKQRSYLSSPFLLSLF